jgi:hypothetical protein
VRVPAEYPLDRIARDRADVQLGRAVADPALQESHREGPEGCDGADVADRVGVVVLGGQVDGLGDALGRVDARSAARTTPTASSVR